MNLLIVVGPVSWQNENGLIIFVGSLALLRVLRIETLAASASRLGAFKSPFLTDAMISGMEIFEARSKLRPGDNQTLISVFCLQ